MVVYLVFCKNRLHVRQLLPRTFAITMLGPVFFWRTACDEDIAWWWRMCVWTLFLHYFSCDSVRHLAFVVFGCLPFFRLFLPFSLLIFLFFFDMVAVKCKSHKQENKTSKQKKWKNTTTTYKTQAREQKAKQRQLLMKKVGSSYRQGSLLIGRTAVRLLNWTERRQCFFFLLAVVFCGPP